MLSTNTSEMHSGALDIFFLCDCSGSMSGKKIGAVNSAMKRVFVDMASRDFEQRPIRLSVMRFANEAAWHLHPERDVSGVGWIPLYETGGLTALGAAVNLLTEYLEALETDGQADRAGPIIIMISDGKPTDDALTSMKKLVAGRAGRHSVRYSIGIGNDVDAELLQQLASPGHYGFVDDFQLLDLQEQLIRFVEQGIAANQQGVVPALVMEGAA